MRRNDDQAGTGLTRFPIDLPRLYARLLRLLAPGQHNPMPVFRTAAHGDGLSAQLRIQQHLDGCVEAIRIDVQDASVWHIQSSM